MVTIHPTATLDAVTARADGQAHGRAARQPAARDDASRTRRTSTGHPTRRTASTALVRTVDGTEVPAAGRWRVPSSYVAVSFRGGGRLVRRVHGRLRADDGLIVIGDDPLSSTIDLPIDVTTIRTGHSRLDHELGHRLGDALGAPIVAFHGRLQGCLSLDEWTVTGALRGPALTLPTSATATYRGVFRRPGGAGALWLTQAVR